MKKIVLANAVLVCTIAAFTSCGTYNSNPQSNPSGHSGLKFRAFVSNPLQPSGTGAFSQVLNIVDASKDQLSFSVVNLTGSSNSPGLMALSPSKLLLLVYSSVGNSIAVVSTAQESLAGSTSSLSTITLPGPTESMFVSADNVTGYAAVPSVPVTTSPPTTGAVVVFSLATNSINATLPVSGVQVVVGSHNGNRVLALSQDSDTVTVIAPSLIGSSNDPRSLVTCVIAGVPTTQCFDHPASALFSSDDTTAYVLNCGAECGGTTAGVSVIDMNTNTVTATIPVAGGSTVGLLQGSTLYVAGTPPGTACGSGTSATTCGMLSIVDLGSQSVTNTSPILITDGEHNRMEMSSDGQLFIGAKTCTSISTSSEVRGCLSIYNPAKSTVVIPPDAGDVTGIQPIRNRNVVYVCQNELFRVYDTTTDQLQVPPDGQTAIIVVGQAVDVKLVD